MYQCLFYGTDVTREDNILTANFSGKVLKLGGTDGFIPPAAERERIGDMAHYFIPFVLRDMSIGFGNSMEVMYHVVLNTETGKAAVCSVQPGNAVFNESTLLSGKQEDVDVSQWPRATFLDIRRKQLTRDENGVILPVEEWPEDSWITGIDIMDPKTLEIVYEPLDAGEYFLVMEVRDVYGNRYCSELFPIESNGRKIK